jgi:hypothetical protein
MCVALMSVSVAIPISSEFPWFRQLVTMVMRNMAVLFLHLLATVARPAGPGGGRPWWPSPLS